MENCRGEHYKGHIIVILAGPDSKSKWKPTCKILAEESRQFVKDLKWVLDYDTQEQAERAGALIAQHGLIIGRQNLINETIGPRLEHFSGCSGMSRLTAVEVLHLGHPVAVMHNRRSSLPAFHFFNWLAG